jgi:inosine-uridine nucleoside N-ribohydrolase
VEDYDLASYPGQVHEDGVGAMIDLIMAAEEKITLLAIGPVPNLKAALEREPRLAGKARLVAMAGGVYKQYNGKPGRCAEYNVKEDVPAAQRAFSAPWDVTLAPLDTAGVVCLTGDPYRRVRDAHNPLTTALLENYRIWSKDPDRPNEASSILFDTVAAYLTFRTDWLEMRDIALKVNDQGETVPADDGKVIHAAVEWTDLEAFYGFLAERLSRGVAEEREGD